MYGALTGRFPAKLLALFTIRNTQQDTVCRLAGVEMMCVINSEHLSDLHGLVTLHLMDNP